MIETPSRVDVPGLLNKVTGFSSRPTEATVPPVRGWTESSIDESAGGVKTAFAGKKRRALGSMIGRKRGEVNSRKGVNKEIFFHPPPDWADKTNGRVSFAHR